MLWTSARQLANRARELIKKELLRCALLDACDVEPSCRHACRFVAAGLVGVPQPGCHHTYAVGPPACVVQDLGKYCVLHRQAKAKATPHPCTLCLPLWPGPPPAPRACLRGLRPYSAAACVVRALSTLRPCTLCLPLWPGPPPRPVLARVACAHTQQPPVVCAHLARCVPAPCACTCGLSQPLRPVPALVGSVPKCSAATCVLQDLDEYYEFKAGYGKPTALLLFELASSRQEEDNFHIW